jgi:murein DD-endopeptidase MepM/ murein hydrolase activator NlpD
MVKYLLKNDKDLIKSLNAQNAKLKSDRTDLNKKNQLLLLNENQYDRHSKKLNNESKSLNAMLSTLVLEKKLFLKKQKDLKASRDKLELEFQKIEGQRLANPGKLEAEITKDAPAQETAPPPIVQQKVAKLPESASKAAKVMNFSWPIDRKDRKSFAQLGKAGSYALNIFVKSESEVKTAGRGKILYKGNIGGLGNVIIVGHERGFSTVYAKIDDIWVGLGQIVEKNSTIGRIYGTKDSPLHFEIRFGGKKQPPLNFLPSIK